MSREPYRQESTCAGRPKRKPDRVNGVKYLPYYLTAFLYPLVDKLRTFTELDPETIEVLSL
jgi:hypothetical protein